MEIQILATTFGHIIGEQTRTTDTHIHVTTPGIIQAAQTQEGTRFVIGEIIPPFVENQATLEKDLPVPRAMILFAGKADPRMIEMYEQYKARQVQKRSGLHLLDGKSGRDVLHKIKGGKNRIQ